MTATRIKTPLTIDQTVTLNVNNSTQQLRMCAARSGLPPLLVVQGGPALPLLHDVRKVSAPAEVGRGLPRETREHPGWC